MADKMNYVTSGAKLGFKTGTQAKINEMILNQNLVTPDSSKLATNGTFYLTQDTHRLYVGNEDGSISSVNEGIVIVNQVSDLPDATEATLGQFYYISGANVLAVCAKNTSSTTNKKAGWIQINAEKHTESSTFHAEEVEDATENGTYSGDAYVTHTLLDNNGDALNTYFKVEGTNGVTVELDPNGTTTNGLTGGNEVTHSNVPTFTISGDPYDISAVVATQATATSLGANNKDAVIKITSESGDESTVILRPNTGSSVSFENGSADNVILVNGANATLSSGSITPKDGTNNEHGYEISVSDSETNSVELTLDPVIKLGSNNTEYHFDENVATLPVYTSSEVDEKFRLLNGMTYKGTVGSVQQNGNPVDGSVGFKLDNNGIIVHRDNTSDTTGTQVQAKVGDVFVLTSAMSVGGITCPVGTILIAKGTESETTGYIQDASGNPNYTFDLIMGTTDHDSQFELRMETVSNVNVIDLYNKSSGDSVGKVTFASGSDGKVSASVSSTNTGSSNDPTTTVTLSHTEFQTNPAATTETGIITPLASVSGNNVTVGSDSFVAVTGMTVDKSGHVSGWTTKQVTLRDSNATVSSYSTNNSKAIYTTSGGTSVGVLSTELTLSSNSSDQSQQEANIALCSDTLTIAKPSETIGDTSSSANAIGALKLDLLWGSF